nr:PD-(D/E)XK motif protein [Nevskia ramosa]
MASIQVRVLEDDRVWLDVSAKNHHEDLFTMLVNKILVAILVAGRDPVVSVESTIDDVRAAFRPVQSELGVTEQIGLFGELWVLANVLIPQLGSRSVDIWSGPARERHDFAGLGAHLEVKTTTRSEEKHEISRLDQLRAPLGKKLLLASVMVERSIGGETTVADLIDNVIELLASEGRAIDNLDVALRKIGWHDGLRQSGALLRFSLRDVNVFLVEGTFPRLPDDYVSPRGVTAIKYVIDVSACPALSTEQTAAIVATM